MVGVHTLHVTCGVDQAVRWVCGDGHSTPKVLHGEAEGMPLTGITPGIQGFLYLLEVNLDVVDEFRDPIWWI